MIYKKKPLQVDAFKYDGDFIDDNGMPYVPNWAIEALRRGDLYYSSQGAEDFPPNLFVKTRLGATIVDVGFYIGIDEKGIIRGWHPQIFEKIYEIAEEK